MDMGIKHVMRETCGSSLEMTEECSRRWGTRTRRPGRRWSASASTMSSCSRPSYPFHKDEKKLAEMAAQARKELESLFEQDAAEEKKVG